MFFVGDNPDFCNARYVNPDFSQVSKNKTILSLVIRLFRLRISNELSAVLVLFWPRTLSVFGCCPRCWLNSRTTVTVLRTLRCSIRIFRLCPQR